MNSEVIYLVKETYSTDALGNQKPTEASVKVYAKKQSVRTSTFYAASQSGFKPEAEFVIRKAEYSGQQLLDWNDERYSIIQKIDKGAYNMVLVCEMQTGKPAPEVSA